MGKLQVEDEHQLAEDGDVPPVKALRKIPCRPFGSGN
jgi:hypothetical protein